jgi:hypothetical protein
MGITCERCDEPRYHQAMTEDQPRPAAAIERHLGIKNTLAA